MLTVAKRVRIWNPPTGARLLELNHDLVRAAAFNPKGDRLLTGGQDGTVKIWDTESGKEILLLRHPNQVCAASFSPDGATILTGT